jgi:hypothetical protein
MKDSRKIEREEDDREEDMRRTRRGQTGQEDLRRTIRGH